MINFIAGLWIDLAIIINRSNLADLDEAKKIIKNIESISFINKNIMTAATNLTVAEIKELKAQILKLKVELKESK